MQIKAFLANKFARGMATGAAAVALIVAAMCIPTHAAEVNLKIGVVTPTAHPHSVSARKFAELVAQKSGGEVEIKVFDNASLGKNKELLDGVKTGIVDFTIIPPSIMATYAEKSALGLFEIPYVFADKSHMLAVTRGPLGAQIAADYKRDAGMEILGYLGGAQRNMITTDQAIRTQADLRGLKMRTWPDQIQLAWWKSLGALGTVVAFPEVYTALQTGAVDGAENEFSTFTSARWAEVAKNIALTQHTITVRPLIGNAKKLARLSANAQRAIREAALETADFDVELEGKKDVENQVKLKVEYGVKFTTPDKAPLIRASAAVLKKVAADKGISELATQIAAAAK